MSGITDWLTKTLANAESGVVAELEAIGPELAQAAGIALSIGISTVGSTSGTLTQKLEAGLGAVSSTAKSLAPTLVVDSLNSALHLAVAANPGLFGAVTGQPGVSS